MQKLAQAPLDPLDLGYPMDPLDLGYPMDPLDFVYPMDPLNLGDPMNPLDILDPRGLLDNYSHTAVLVSTCQKIIQFLFETSPLYKLDMT